MSKSSFHVLPVLSTKVERRVANWFVKLSRPATSDEGAKIKMAKYESEWKKMMDDDPLLSISINATSNLYAVIDKSKAEAARPLQAHLKRSFYAAQQRAIEHLLKQHDFLLVQAFFQSRQELGWMPWAVNLSDTLNVVFDSKCYGKSEDEALLLPVINILFDNASSDGNTFTSAELTRLLQKASEYSELFAKDQKDVIQQTLRERIHGIKTQPSARTESLAVHDENEEKKRNDTNGSAPAVSSSMTNGNHYLPKFSELQMLKEELHTKSKEVDKLNRHLHQTNLQIEAFKTKAAMTAVGPGPAVDIKQKPKLEEKMWSSSSSSSAAQLPSGEKPAALPIPATVGVRQDLRLFFYPQHDDPEVLRAALQRRDLFILGFQRWQSLPKEDPNSYIQLASVHGRPMSVGYGVDAFPDEIEQDPNDSNIPIPFQLIKMKYVDRDGDGVQFSNFGTAEFAYCKHGRPTFMTWHRPYVYLVEKAIIKSAKYLVDNGLIRGDLEAARREVERVRLPYWNWGLNAPVPDVLLCDTIELSQFSLDGQGVSSPASDYDIRLKQPHRTVIKNPFKSFNPSAQQYSYFNGEVPEPDKWNAPQGVSGTLTDYLQNCVFGPEGTLRQPGWSDYLYRFLVRDLRKYLSQAFMVGDFIAADGSLKNSGSHWFEMAHNALHNVFAIALAPEFGLPSNTTPPPKPNMTGTRQSNNEPVILGRAAMINDMSTMDPAFWFHHCFVDAQISMHRQSFPGGIYIKPGKLDPSTDPKVYPAEDPVPDSADLQPGQSRDWLVSPFHPWSKGLFRDEIYPNAEPVAVERKKKWYEKDYVVQYVSSADVENSLAWGYTFDLLLKAEYINCGTVELRTSQKEAWLTPEDTQEKFIFDFAEDPFIKLVEKLPPPPWEISKIPADLLRELIRSATNQQWMLTMDLPKFFKIDDDGGVGRSYAVNVFYADSKEEVEKIMQKPSPENSDVFVGSSSVFAPFNLRQCLNCQKNNSTWPVAVDLTEIVIRKNMIHLSPQQILDRLILIPIGVPSSWLPPTNEQRKKDWKAQVVATVQQRPTTPPDSFPSIVYEFKQELGHLFNKAADANGASAAQPRALFLTAFSDGAPALERAASAWREFQVKHQDQLNKIVSLLKNRDRPQHQHSLRAPHT